MEEKLSYRSKRGNCSVTTQKKVDSFVHLPQLYQGMPGVATLKVYTRCSVKTTAWGHQPHTYLGCSPSSRFWHLRIWGLRCRTSNRVSCLLCRLGVTGRKREKTSMYELIRIPECSKSQLRESTLFPKHVFKIISNFYLYINFYSIKEKRMG